MRWSSGRIFWRNLQLHLGFFEVYPALHSRASPCEDQNWTWAGWMPPLSLQQIEKDSYSMLDLYLAIHLPQSVYTVGISWDWSPQGSKHPSRAWTWGSTRRDKGLSCKEFLFHPFSRQFWTFSEYTLRDTVLSECLLRVLKPTFFLHTFFSYFVFLQSYNPTNSRYHFANILIFSDLYKFNSKNLYPTSSFFSAFSVLQSYKMRVSVGRFRKNTNFVKYSYFLQHPTILHLFLHNHKIYINNINNW